MSDDSDIVVRVFLRQAKAAAERSSQYTPKQILECVQGKVWTRISSDSGKIVISSKDGDQSVEFAVSSDLTDRDIAVYSELALQRLHVFNDDIDRAIYAKKKLRIYPRFGKADIT